MSDTTAHLSSAGEPEAPGERPSSYRSAAYSQASLARLTLSGQARELADAVYGLVAPESGVFARDGELVEEAARLVEAARGLLESAVVCERMRGAGWERIGAALGGVGHQAARERYARAAEDYQRRLLHAWLRPGHAREVFTTADDLAGLVARLNAWVAAHGDGDGDQPSGAGLAPMSTAERSALIAQAAALLAQAAAGPGGGDHRLLELEIGLRRREIELYDDLAAETPGDAGVLAALAGARASLAVLVSGGTGGVASDRRVSPGQGDGEQE
ncbi:hypothetical protein [Streptosporangium sp. KLBMP 9127]|nr:hypothetical protein [Streptosporangium sp. KLBMP 9127]